jgi:hypothetical protein
MHVADGFGKKVFKSGDRHEGYYKNGKRYGKGTYLWACGDKYVGDWVDGLMSNNGCFLWSCGDQYIGGWHLGKHHGKGRKSFVDGSVIDGEFANGTAHGKCKKVFACGDIFEGIFMNDERHGFGKYTWRDGSAYVGEWEHDKMTGECRRANKSSEIVSGTCSNGLQISPLDPLDLNYANVVVEYKGDLSDGCYHGWGAATFVDGSSYVGNWTKGLFNGWGKFETTGSVYEGEFVDGKMHGYGMMLFSPQEANEGTDENVASTANTCIDIISALSMSAANVEEVLISSTMQQLNNLGEAYIGEWKADSINGFGVMVYENRSAYIGEFVMSVRDGSGTLVDFDSWEFKRGIWEDDSLIISCI